MFDIHCHLIYGVDDGADGLGESVDMIELAARQGTKGIVATPHSNISGSYQNYWSVELLNKVKELRRVVKEKNIDMKIFCGQEIFCNGSTLRLLKDGQLITLNNSKYPLVEFDFYEYSESVYSKLKQLTAEGYVPVVAHPERYNFVSEDRDAINKLKNIGCLIQINKGSLNGNFGENAFYNSQRMIEERLADVIASDAHSPYIRNTDMSEAHEYISEEFSADYADLITTINPARILQNKEIISY